MKKHVLVREQFVPRQRSEVFSFFSRPENLGRLTPDSLGFQILTPSPIRMQRGAIVDYTITIAGIRSRWRTIITEYEPEHSFVDEQLSGPYSFWHHRHTFVSVDGGTLISDEVQYVVPFGWLGEIAHALFIRRQLETIFRYRENTIDRLFGRRDAVTPSAAVQKEGAVL